MKVKLRFTGRTNTEVAELLDNLVGLGVIVFVITILLLAAANLDYPQ